MDLFREQDIKWGKEKGDAAWNWEEIIKGIPGKLAEMGDGPTIGLFLKQLNKWLSPQLEDDVKEGMHYVFDYVIKEDYGNALAELADVAIIITNKEEIPARLRPWLIAIIEIYKGIINQLVS